MATGDRLPAAVSEAAGRRRVFGRLL